MPERTAFPNGIPMPSDPRMPMTPEQLHALFPDRQANERFAKGIVRLAHQNQLQHTAASQPVRNGVVNGR